jgi:signal peptidase I
MGKSIDLHKNGKIKIINIYEEKNNKKKYNIQTKKINNGKNKIYKIKLKEKEFFVLGDNRTNSYDSRFFGPIKERDIQGKVNTIITSLDNLNIRKDRIFKKI